MEQPAHGVGARHGIKVREQRIAERGSRTSLTGAKCVWRASPEHEAASGVCFVLYQEITKPRAYSGTPFECVAHRALSCDTVIRDGPVEMDL